MVCRFIKILLMFDQANQTFSFSKLKLKERTTIHHKVIASTSRGRYVSTWTATCVACLVLALIGPSQIAAEAEGHESTGIQELVPLPVHPRTSTIIVDQIRANHLLRSKRLNDETSSEIFDHYLHLLDPRKLYLLQADVDEFEKYRYEFDDNLKKGHLGAGFDMFNRVHRRGLERVDWLIKRLEEGLDSFDLYSNESLLLDVEQSVWFPDIESANSEWEKHLVNEIITAKLQGRQEDEIEKTLTRRYQAQHKYMKRADSEDAFSAYINAFTTSYDPHTFYQRPRIAKEFNASMSLSLEGIGARLNIKDDWVHVVDLVPGGPADLEGSLKPSDRIIAVGQGSTAPMIDVVGWPLDDVVDLIRGPKGSSVRLDVVAEGLTAADRRQIKIKRDEIKLEEGAAKRQLFTIEHAGEARKVGYIDLPSMYRDLLGEQRREQDFRSATRDVSRLINELKNEGMEALVFDLRSNGGGSLEEAVDLVGLFIEAGPVVQAKGMRNQVYLDRNRDIQWDGPLAVLIDRRSASASEIFAAAIQDYDRGIVIGNTTFGKGTVQTLQPVHRGSLKLTIQKYYRINGGSTQNSGVSPDIRFPASYDPEHVGEHTHPTALPWDQTKPLRYSSSDKSQVDLETLEEAHLARVKSDPYFIHRQASNVLQDSIERDFVSLNFALRDAQERNWKNKRLEIGNVLLKDLGEDPVESIGDLLAKTREIADARDEANLPSPYIAEASRILLDYANPNFTAMLAATPPLSDTDYDELRAASVNALEEPIVTDN